MSYIPSSQQERQEMLQTVGVAAMDNLFAVVPSALQIKQLNLPSAKSELEVSRMMRKIAGKNRVFSSIFRGAGAYHHYIPSIVKSITAKESFLTAYTPYQAEISQGILQSIFEYQTMICELTGMDVSNASIYDGASAAAEAMTMCHERKRDRVLISATVLPMVIQTVQTYCNGNDMTVELIPEKSGVTDIEALETMLNDKTACVYLQQPNYFGMLEAAEKVGEAAHRAGAKFVMGINPIAAAVLKTPRDCGADIAVGEGQPLGMPLSFGGPYLGFMATNTAMTRRLPGRIVGETVDIEGKRAFVLTLQAREQHIRREKASSNVCSNQALCAMTASVYCSAMGPSGLQEVANQCHAKAHYAARQISAIPGFALRNQGEFFHEFLTETPCRAETVLAKLAEKDILGGYPVSNGILWCVTEMNSKAQIDALTTALKEVSLACN